MPKLHKTDSDDDFDYFKRPEKVIKKNTRSRKVISDDKEDDYFQSHVFPDMLDSIVEQIRRDTKASAELTKRIEEKSKINRERYERKLKEAEEAKKKKRSIPDTKKLEKEIDKWKKLWLETETQKANKLLDTADDLHNLIQDVDFYEVNKYVPEELREAVRRRATEVPLGYDEETEDLKDMLKTLQQFKLRREATLVKHPEFSKLAKAERELRVKEQDKQIDKAMKDVVKLMETIQKTKLPPKRSNTRMSTTKVVKSEPKRRTMSTKKVVETAPKPKRVTKAQKEREVVEEYHQPEVVWKRDFKHTLGQLSVYVGMMERSIDRVKHFTKEMLDASSELREENKEAKEVYATYKKKASETIGDIKGFVKEGKEKGYATKQELEDALVKENIPKYATKFQEYSKFKFK